MRIRVHQGDTLDGEDLCLEPTKIVAVGRNYRAHAAELGNEPPTEPLIFLKPPSAIIEHGASIVRPRGFERVDFEAELAIVIGKRCRSVASADALECVLGYTCLNDVTVRDLQKSDDQWTRAKGFDTFCPIGPRVVAGLDPRDLRITSRVNGTVRQDSRTSHMIFPVPELISFITAVMTLEKGDVIATGTPAGVGNLRPGDTVDIDIEGIGVLSNPVVETPS